MELVEGQTLSTLITPGGLPFPKLLELAIPLTDALVPAHERGVIHRDLKSGNVLVTPEGRVKVLAFGLPKIATGESAAAQRSVATTVDLPPFARRDDDGADPTWLPSNSRKAGGCAK